MKKDPVKRHGFKVSRDCSENTCVTTATKKLNTSFVEKNGVQTPVFNASDHLLQPGAPITPLYSFSQRIPSGGEIKNIEVRSNFTNRTDVEVPETELLTSSGSYVNTSMEYDVFPADVSDVETSEDEVTVVHTGMQKVGNTTKILENVEVEIEYTSPVVLALERDGKTVFATVDSEKRREAKLIYSIDGETHQKDVEVGTGVNRFKLEEIEEGETRVKAYLVDKEVLSSTEKSFQVAEPLRAHLFSPDIHVGETRNIRAVVTNPNNFEVEETVSLETGNVTQLAFLEEAGRSLDFKPNETRTVSWRLTGLKKGNETVRLHNTPSSLEATNSMNAANPISTCKFIKKINGRESSSPLSVTSIRETTSLRPSRAKVTSV